MQAIESQESKVMPSDIVSFSEVASALTLVFDGLKMLDVNDALTSVQSIEYDNINTMSSTNEDRDLSISDVHNIVVIGNEDLNFDLYDNLNLVGENELDVCLPC